jgi:Ca2+-binding RTX toxin-like protein
MDRAPSAAEIDVWIAALAAGTTRGSLLMQVSESAEHVAIMEPRLAGGVHLAGGTDWIEGFQNVVGGKEADLIRGTAGNDVLRGAAGNDVLAGGAGDDSLVGGSGRDTLSFDDAAAPVFVDLMSGTVTGEGADTVSGVEDVLGSRFADTIYGDTPTANLLFGMDGNDSVRGNSGADTLFGGNGNDSLNGGAHDDLVYGEAGNDSLLGHVGHDLLSGGDGADTLNGQGDNDTLQGGISADRLLGDLGDDHLSGGDGADTLQGGPGADTLVGGTGADRFSFAALTESGDTVADLLLEFLQADGDKIDISVIDPSPLAGNQAFAFVGQAAFLANGTAQVRYSHAGGQTFIELDTGDGIADTWFKISGIYALTAHDFVL